MYHYRQRVCKVPSARTLAKQDNPARCCSKHCKFLQCFEVCPDGLYSVCHLKSLPDGFRQKAMQVIINTAINGKEQQLALQHVAYQLKETSDYP